MDKYKLFLSDELGFVEIDIIRKKVKNIYLKVYQTKKVSLTIPPKTNKAWLQNFFEQKKVWIINQFSKIRHHTDELDKIENGAEITFLGKKLQIIVECSKTKHIEILNDKLYIYLKNDLDSNSINNYFEKFWKECAIQLFKQELKILYDKLFTEYKIDMPNLYIRKMKSLWGSCIPKKNKITLNSNLLKKPLLAIQYVIVHELSHLLIPNHSKEFYGFLTEKMPDWKERKKLLENN